MSSGDTQDDPRNTEFPPPEATKLESFGLHVATMPDDSVAVCLQVPDKEDPPEFKTLMCGCEYLMSVVARESHAGFEAALDALVSGAMKYQTYRGPEAGKGPVQRKDYHFVVQRPGESTFCIVRAQTTDRVETDRQLMYTIQQSVTDWIVNTEEGKAAYIESSEDMNVGDLAQYLGDDYLMAALKARGVEYLKLEIQPGSEMVECWSFDTLMFDADAVKEALPDEED